MVAVAANFVEMEPAGMVTEAGTLTPARLLESATDTPPAAAALSAAVQVEDWPAAMLLGEHVRLYSCGVCDVPVIVIDAVFFTETMAAIRGCLRRRRGNRRDRKLRRGCACRHGDRRRKRDTSGSRGEGHRHSTSGSR